jgi:class 3 adenylate cyclase
MPTATTSMSPKRIVRRCSRAPCIAVTLNDRLDYFGRTVNLAARLQGESRGGDIVLSEAMLAEPGLQEALGRLMPSAETARVKGFSETIALRRVPAPA